MPLRRDGKQRSAKSVADIVTILTFLDEKLKLNCLPRYVSVSPDAMPSIRIYDGDLQSIMMAFDKLRNRMDQAEAALAAILETVNATKYVLVTRSTPASLQSQLPSCRV